MRNLLHVVVVAAVVTPVVLLAGGAASADSYDQRMTSVGPAGASTRYVSTGTTFGGAYYAAGDVMAGSDGAASSHTRSIAGGAWGASGVHGGLLGLGRLLG
ncbi:hypothetical protein V1460_02960 [Streptomyces sp. SCSIO 30461]|uniref:hypothetical protein n=1 Tax=Streptomyces sp. SCSIO 30461 TaxID=3118085 RepID=UPI0030CBB40C